MFNQPASFDDSRNLSQWIRYTAEHSPDHALFVYESSGPKPHVVTWSEIGTAVERAACVVDSLFDLARTRAGEDQKALPVIGILANLDSITYNVLYLGILRAGGTAFLLSTKNAPVAVSQLLKKTGTHKLLVSMDETIQTLARSSVGLALKEDHQVAMCAVPSLQTLFEDSDVQFLASAGLDTHLDAPAVILHSSGSTSFPKPITITHRVVLRWAAFCGISGVDETKHTLAVHAMPVYHSMGFAVTFWAVRTGLTLGVFPPKTPPVIPSPATVLESAVASQSTFMCCVPLFIELWSRDHDAVAKLKNFRGVVYGGGPCNPAIGDELEQLGVQLISIYGSTETGPVTCLVPREPSDHEWDWLQVHPLANTKFLPQEDPNTFELVYVECPTHIPAVFNAVVDGKRAFATNDIVIRHPTDPLRFKVQGRKDDQIMLSSGEKTNPGPIERFICGNPLVETAVMFGRGRDRNGVLIQPAKDYQFDPRDTTKLSRFRNDIWHSVEKATELGPSHSRLFKEMILVTYPWRPMEMTSKGTTRRSAVIEAYKDDIEAAYNAIETSTQTDVTLPIAWNSVEVLAFVRKVIHNVMDKHVRDDADIFVQGCDSLRATYIRNSLDYAVRQARKSATGLISQNFVYANPTIARLVGRILLIVSERSVAEDDESSLELQEMEEMISELSARFPTHRAGDSPRLFSGEVVLVTGTTGGLGSQLLTHLVASPDVSRVYALNRISENDHKSSRNRQKQALIERGLDSTIINSPKVMLIEGDTAADGLGLDPAIYDEIRDNITLIIHNAWKVNFNLGLRGFKQNIQSVRTLIDLALQSPHQNPPRIIYASSVGVFTNWDSEQGPPLESSIVDLRLALGSGYAESKLVGERILENAGKSTPLRPIIVRIGQMTGTSSGAWNSGDWLPAIVRSGQVLGVLPDRQDCISWIPLGISAQAIFEFRHSESQYLHLAHPRPALWSTVFEVFSSRLKVPLVSWTDWLARLERSDGGSEKNPAMHLLDFYRGCVPTSVKNREAPGIPLMDLRQALKHSPSLADPSLPKIGREDAERWLSHWRKIGFLSGDDGKF